MISLEMYLQTKNTQLNFGSHPDVDPDQKIFEGIFTTMG